MSATRLEPAVLPRERDLDARDQRFVLGNVTWAQYETLRALLDDVPGLRMTYLEGALELMSPSPKHEYVKKTLARLIEVYALEMDIDLHGYGSTTFRRKAKERGLEPDECYCRTKLKKVPDLAVEVEVTRAAIDKLSVYAGLGVPELWFWRDGRIAVHVLGPRGYETRARSALLPEIDLRLLGRLAGSSDQVESVRELRRTLRRRNGR